MNITHDLKIKCSKEECYEYVRETMFEIREKY